MIIENNCQSYNQKFYKEIKKNILQSLIVNHIQNYVYGNNKSIPYAIDFYAY